MNDDRDLELDTLLSELRETPSELEKKRWGRAIQRIQRTPTLRTLGQIAAGILLGFILGTLFMSQQINRETNNLEKLATNERIYIKAE